MAIRGRLIKLEERARQHYDVLRLPDGIQVKYTSQDALYALSAAIDDREHCLVSHACRAGTNEGLAGLLRALATSGEHVEQERGEDGS